MINSIIPQNDVNTLKTAIEQASNITIIPHVNPDGDAIGSALGWMHALKSIFNKQASIVAPNSFPDFLKWLPGSEQIAIFESDKTKCSTLIEESDLVFILDFNDIKRAEGITPLLEKKNTIVMIDHHPFPKLETLPMFSYPICSATCELIYRIIWQLDAAKKVTSEAATCLYTGIMTDTGSLSYNSSDPVLYAIVSNLLHCDIDKEYIHDKLFSSQSENRLRLMGYCLSKKMVLIPEYQAAIITLSKEEVAQFKHQQGDTEGFVNIPLSIEGINVSAFMMEKDDMIKISFRSKGDLAVNQLSSNYFNGGGHKNAAGGRLNTSLEEAIDLFKSKVFELFV